MVDVNYYAYMSWSSVNHRAIQVHLVAKRLARHLKLRCLCFTGAFNHKEGSSGAGYRTQVDLLKEGMDLLVATPGCHHITIDCSSHLFNHVLKKKFKPGRSYQCPAER